jgi:hypothetical protein
MYSDIKVTNTPYTTGLTELFPDETLGGTTLSADPHDIIIRAISTADDTVNIYGSTVQVTKAP